MFAYVLTESGEHLINIWSAATRALQTAEIPTEGRGLYISSCVVFFGSNCAKLTGWKATDWTSGRRFVSLRTDYHWPHSDSVPLCSLFNSRISVFSMFKGLHTRRALVATRKKFLFKVLLKYQRSSLLSAWMCSARRQEFTEKRKHRREASEVDGSIFIYIFFYSWTRPTPCGHDKENIDTLCASHFRKLFVIIYVSVSRTI